LSVISLASFCLIISSAFGYGYGFYDAEVKLNGTYYETLGYYDDYAYYKVNCRSGDFLDVYLTYNYPTNLLGLELYDSTQWSIDSESSPDGYDNVYTSVYSLTHYYIVVERIGPSTGTISFTLEISGATGLIIPGFEIIALIIGMISVTGIIYLKINRKKKIII